MLQPLTMIPVKNSEKNNQLESGAETEQSLPENYEVMTWEDLTLLENSIIPVPTTPAFLPGALDRRGPITYITSEYFNLTAHSFWQQCCDNTSGSDSTRLCKPPTKHFFEYIKGCLKAV